MLDIRGSPGVRVYALLVTSARLKRSARARLTAGSHAGSQPPPCAGPWLRPTSGRASSSLAGSAPDPRVCVVRYSGRRASGSGHSPWRHRGRAFHCGYGRRIGALPEPPEGLSANRPPGVHRRTSSLTPSARWAPRSRVVDCSRHDRLASLGHLHMLHRHHLPTASPHPTEGQQPFLVRLHHSCRCVATTISLLVV